MATASRRYQLGHSPYLTVQRDEEGNDVFRSYDTPILVLDEKNKVVWADYRIYSARTTRHQRQLAHFRPMEYVMPEHRERVTYEYCLKHNGKNAWGDLYQPLYRAKDNPYDPWHEVSPGNSFDWDTAYNQLYNKHSELTGGAYNPQAVHDNFVGTF